MTATLEQVPFADICPTPEVAVRDVKEHGRFGELRAFTAEFSMVSALVDHAALRALTRSPSSEHRKHVEQLLKNACVLTVVCGKHGAYKKLPKKGELVARAI